MNVPTTGIPTTTTAAKTGNGSDDKKLKEVCKQLEGVFFQMMLKEMRKTVTPSTLLPDSQHEKEIFQGMMDDKMSQTMADQDTNSSGLAAILFKQLSGNKSYSGAKAAGAAQTTPGQAAQSAEVSAKASR